VIGLLSQADKLKIVSNWPYDQLNPLPRRLLLLNLLLRVDGARELFEQGEAGEAFWLVRQATHVRLRVTDHPKLGPGAGVDKETFLHQILTGLTSDQRVNTYELDEAERAARQGEEALV
jgi:hypothetical protein